MEMYDQISKPRIPLYEQVAGILEEFIIEQGVEGLRLPSEHELTIQYKVSRTVIREALKLLKERGLVSMRVGDGLYTTRPANALNSVMSRIARFDKIDDEQITAVRQMLETASIKEAVRVASDRDFDLLETINQAMAIHMDDNEKRAALDYQFHYTLSKICKNELLTNMVESIMGVLQDYIKRRLIIYPEGNLQGIEEHSKIIEALRARDEKKVTKLITKHIKSSYIQYPKISNK